MMTRRHFLTASAAGGFAFASCPVARPQAYPSRPITMVVAFPAGGPSDATARVLAEQMRGSLGQPVIIENVSGADGSMGTGRVARARPDGYTIELGVTSTHMMNGAVYSLPYDVVNDFAPISPVVAVPPVLFARKTMPAKDLNELIAWLKPIQTRRRRESPRRFFAWQPHSFKKKPPRNSPLYRTVAPPAIQDLVAGQIDMLVSTLDPLPKSAL